MPAGSPIIAVSFFADAGMLWWCAAALAPLAIHLWSRRKFQATPWAAMEPLLAAVRRRARRWRFEQWLLLAVRTAVLLLAGIAWADPDWSSWTSRGGAAVGRSPAHHLLVIDTSYSMAAKAEGRARLDEAREQAIGLVRAARQGDGFTLVTLGRPPVVVIGEPVFDAEVVIEELEGLAVEHTGADLAATLGEVERLVERVARTSDRLDRARVAIWSDLGRTTWGAAETDEVRRQLSRLAERGELRLFDVGRDDLANAAVTRVEVREAVALAGRELTLEAELQNWSSKELLGRTVELRVDGQPFGSRTVDLPAGSRTTIGFSPRVENPGDHWFEVRLRDDDLEVDNARWLALPVRERVRVLCVEGRPGEARFAALALEPAPGATGRVETEVCGETALAERDLSQADAIVLCNVGRFDAAEAAALRRFVQAGGGLAVFLGDLVQPENYHRLLGPGDRGPAVLPARAGAVSAHDGAGVDPLDYRHPLAAPFKGRVEAGLVTTPVWRYFQLTPYADVEQRTALGLPGGAPLAIDGRAGRGRCLLFATAASPDSVDRTARPPVAWTALPAWPSFVPLLQETLLLLLQPAAAARNVEVGDWLEGFESSGTAAGVLEATGPMSSLGSGASSSRLSLIDDDERWRWTFQPPPRAGAYVVRREREPDPARWFAVNVATAEGDLTRADPTSLPAELTRSGDWEAETTAPGARPPGRSWFRLLLAIVGALLIVESTLAWRFGTRTA